MTCEQPLLKTLQTASSTVHSSSSRTKGARTCATMSKSSARVPRFLVCSLQTRMTHLACGRSTCQLTKESSSLTDSYAEAPTPNLRLTRTSASSRTCSSSRIKAKSCQTSSKSPKCCSSWAAALVPRAKEREPST